MEKQHKWSVLGMALVMLASMLALPLPALAAPSLDWQWNIAGGREFYQEPAANDGNFNALGENLQVDLVDGAGKTFALPPVTEMTEGIHYRINGVLPAGLRLSVVQSTGTQVNIYVRGIAGSHTPASNVDGVQLQFLAAAYSDNDDTNVANNTYSSIAIHFLGAGVTATPSGPLFMESSLNDGSMDPAQYVTINLSAEDRFVEETFVEGVHFKTHGLPAGLSVVINRLDNQNLRMQLNGAAVKHEPEDMDHFTLEFMDAALESGDASTLSYLSAMVWPIVFSDPSTMSWSGTAFVESAANNGSVDTVLTVVLGGDTPDTFSSAPGVMDESFYTCSNVPSGLDVEVTVIDASTAEIALTGQAAAHAAADSVTDMEITFRNAAFTSGNAGAIAGSSRSGISVTFDDPSGVQPPDGTSSLVATFTLDSSSYQVNGTSFAMDVAPFATQNRTFVPVRYLAYSLGLVDNGIIWNGSTGQVSLIEGSTIVNLQLNSMWLSVNGVNQLMDVVPLTQQDRVFLPARWVAEAFGAQVEWVPETQTAVIRR